MHIPGVGDGGFPSALEQDFLFPLIDQKLVLILVVGGEALPAPPDSPLSPVLPFLPRPSVKEIQGSI